MKLPKYGAKPTTRRLWRRKGLCITSKKGVPLLHFEADASFADMSAVLHRVNYWDPLYALATDWRSTFESERHAHQLAQSRSSDAYKDLRDELYQLRAEAHRLRAELRLLREQLDPNGVKDLGELATLFEMRPNCALYGRCRPSTEADPAPSPDSRNTP